MLNGTQELATHRKIMKDDYNAAMNWYRAAMQNVNLEEEQSANLDPNLKVPVLMGVASADPVSNEVAIQGMKQYAKDLNIVRFDCGHWIQMEKKDELNATLESHIKAAN
jgi:pimeloyl-ACP methyl ester carboxylesterase